MKKLTGVCNLYISLIAGSKWLFIGQLYDIFLLYLVDVLLHVRSKVQGKSDFFLATWIEKLAIELSRGPRSTKIICVFRRSYSLGEERAILSAFRTFVRFVLV